MIDRLENRERDEIWCCKKCADVPRIITDDQLKMFVDKVADLCADGYMEGEARIEAFEQMY